MPYVGMFPAIRGRFDRLALRNIRAGGKPGPCAVRDCRSMGCQSTPPGARLIASHQPDPNVRPGRRHSRRLDAAGRLRNPARPRRGREALLCRFDRDGFLTSANTACARFFGAPPAELVGRHFTSFVETGDEFAVLQPQVDQEADVDAVARPAPAEGGTGPDSGHAFGRHLLEQADRALYAVKESGRGFHTFDTSSTPVPSVSARSRAIWWRSRRTVPPWSARSAIPTPSAVASPWARHSRSSPESSAASHRPAEGAASLPAGRTCFPLHNATRGTARRITMTSKPGYWTSLHGLVTLVLVVAALYFLLVEHGRHTLPYLPFMIFLLCPLMHLFMHKGHAGHDRPEQSAQDAEQACLRGLEEGRRNAGH